LAPTRRAAARTCARKLHQQETRRRCAGPAALSAVSARPSSRKSCFAPPTDGAGRLRAQRAPPSAYAPPTRTKSARSMRLFFCFLSFPRFGTGRQRPKACLLTHVLAPSPATMGRPVGAETNPSPPPAHGRKKDESTRPILAMGCAARSAPWWPCRRPSDGRRGTRPRDQEQRAAATRGHTAPNHARATSFNLQAELQGRPSTGNHKPEPLACVPTRRSAALLSCRFAVNDRRADPALAAQASQAECPGKSPPAWI